MSISISPKEDIPGLNALRTLCGVILADESPPLIASSWYLSHKSDARSVCSKNNEIYCSWMGSLGVQRVSSRHLYG